MGGPGDPVEYQARLADAALRRRLEAFSAVMINGVRAGGKTTTAARYAADVVRLDQPAAAAAFRADPDAALRTAREPVLLDEWQEVPEILGAVKRAVDADGRPGRFLLTGSVRAEHAEQLWPATGRAVRMTMYGLTEREVDGRGDEPGPGFLQKLEAADPDAFTLPRAVPDLPGYVELALRGGFPQSVFHLPDDEARRLWLDSYLEQLLTRDALHVEPGRDPARLQRYFEALAASTAGMPADVTLYDAAGINAKTAAAYESLLSNLYVYEPLPAHSNDRLSRLVRARKRYVVDCGLVASALRVTVADVLADGDLFGRVLDTFAVAQLRPEVALAEPRRSVSHLRDKNGRREVDLVVELGRGRVLGLEFKATASPTSADSTHLMWLRDQLGSRFVAGAVLHTGPAAFVLDDRIFAVPLCALWG